MKILILNNLYKPFGSGGAENVLDLQKTGLEESGHQVHVLCARPAFVRRFEQAHNTTYIPSLYAYLSSMPLIFKYLWHMAELINPVKYLKVKKILKTVRPDLVISHNMLGLGLLGFRLLNNYRHVHILHDVQLYFPAGTLFYGYEKKADSLSMKLYRLAARPLAASPERIVSPSRWLLDEHLRRGFFPLSRTEVLPNPLAWPVFAAEASLRTAQKFIFAGRLSRAKGLGVLLSAWQIACKQDRSLELSIAGPKGDLPRQELRGVKYLGFLSSVELSEHMRVCDCLIMPSLVYENSPMVVIEAFRSGLAVIASDIGGIPELKKFGTIYLVKPGSVSGLAAAIISASKKPLYRKTAEKILSPRQYAQVLLKMLD